MVGGVEREELYEHSSCTWWRRGDDGTESGERLGRMMAERICQLKYMFVQEQRDTWRCAALQA
jgi:hypothetical protein